MKRKERNKKRNNRLLEPASGVFGDGNGSKYDNLVLSFSSSIYPGAPWASFSSIR
jgi:hypothetical protein